MFSASSFIFVFATVTYFLIRNHFRKKTAQEDKAESHSTPFDRALIAIVATGQIFLPVIFIFTPLLNFANIHIPLVLELLGAIVMLAGLWLFWRSHHDLGDNWSITLEKSNDHQLITNGIYHYIRHPMYASFFVMALGQIMLLNNLVAGPAALIAVSLLYAFRVGNEEKMMIEFFGDEYKTYRASTGGVLPKIG